MLPFSLSPAARLKLFAWAVPSLLGLAALVMVGCQSSRAWRTVVQAKVPGRGDGAQSHRYAVGLRAVLQEQGIRNQLVTFRYQVRGQFPPVYREETAVRYEDEAHPRTPWWLKRAERPLPVWLPNAPVARQLSFALRRPVQIVSLSPDTEAKDSPALEGAIPSEPSAPQADDLQAFRAAHGTTFDPESAVDREKMATLKARR